MDDGGVDALAGVIHAVPAGGLFTWTLAGTSSTLFRQNFTSPSPRLHVEEERTSTGGWRGVVLKQPLIGNVILLAPPPSLCIAPICLCDTIILPGVCGLGKPR